MYRESVVKNDRGKSLHTKLLRRKRNKSPATSDWFQIKHKPALKAIMVSDNQWDQYFQFVKDMLLEDVISEPLIHSAYYVNQNTIRDLDKVMLLRTW